MDYNIKKQLNFLILIIIIYATIFIFTNDCSIISITLYFLMIYIFIKDFFHFNKYIVQNYYYNFDKDSFIIYFYGNGIYNKIYEIEVSKNKFLKIKNWIDKYNSIYINDFGYIQNIELKGTN